MQAVCGCAGVPLLLSADECDIQLFVHLSVCLSVSVCDMPVVCLFVEEFERLCRRGRGFGPDGAGTFQ